MKTSRILEIDALRGIAAIAVLIFHYFYKYDVHYQHQNLEVAWAQYGAFGVQLFFMLSGFVILWTLKNAKHPMDFIVSRVSRLYPAYWAAAFLTFWVVYFFGLPGREVSASTALANGLMFQEYFHIKNIDGVYWSLAVELAFYFWMFAFYIFGGLEKVEYFLMSVVVVALLQSASIIQIPELVRMIMFSDYANFFLAGICIFNLKHNQKILLSLAALALSLVATIQLYSFTFFLCFLFLYIVFYMAVIGKLPFLKLKPMVFLGSISYSLYLIHQNIGYVIINYMTQYNFTPIIAIFTATAVCILIATVFYYLIEQPALKYIKLGYTKIKQRGLNPKLKTG